MAECVTLIAFALPVYFDTEHKVNWRGIAESLVGMGKAPELLQPIGSREHLGIPDLIIAANGDQNDGTGITPHPDGATVGIRHYQCSALRDHLELSFELDSVAR